MAYKLFLPREYLSPPHHLLSKQKHIYIQLGQIYNTTTVGTYILFVVDEKVVILLFSFTG